MNSVLLFQIEKVYSGTILKRPSQYCKSPYVADVLLDNNEIIAHSPSLGCCGLAEKDSNVIMSKIEKKSKQKSVCEYKIELAIHKEKDEDVYCFLVRSIHRLQFEILRFDSVLYLCGTHIEYDR